MKNILNKKNLLVFIGLFTMSFISGVNNFFTVGLKTVFENNEDMKKEAIKIQSADAVATTKKFNFTPIASNLLKIINMNDFSNVKEKEPASTVLNEIYIEKLQSGIAKKNLLDSIFNNTATTYKNPFKAGEDIKFKAIIMNRIVKSMVCDFFNKKNKASNWLPTETTLLPTNSTNNNQNKINFSTIKTTDAINFDADTTAGTATVQKSFTDFFVNIFPQKLQLKPAAGKDFRNSASKLGALLQTLFKDTPGSPSNSAGVYTGELLSNVNNIKELFEKIETHISREIHAATFYNDLNTAFDSFFTELFASCENVKNIGDLAFLLEYETNTDLFKKEINFAYKGTSDGDLGRLEGDAVTKILKFDDEKAKIFFDNIAINECGVAIKTAQQQGSLPTCAKPNCRHAKTATICEDCYNNKSPIPKNASAAQPLVQPNTQLESQISSSLLNLKNISTYNSVATDKTIADNAIQALTGCKKEIDKLNDAVTAAKALVTTDAEKLKNFEDEEEKRKKSEEGFRGTVKKHSGIIIPAQLVIIGILIATMIYSNKKSEEDFDTSKKNIETNFEDKTITTRD